MRNLILGFFLLFMVLGCKKNPPPQTHNCDNITSIDQLPWLKDLAEGKTDCKIYPYASITKFKHKDTTVFLFRNPGSVDNDEKCSGAYFNCEGKQINSVFNSHQEYAKLIDNLNSEQLFWQAKNTSPDNCDNIVSIDQLPWAKEIVTGKAKPFCFIYQGAYFAKYNYKGKTVFEFRNPASSRGGVCNWVIYDCVGNVILKLDIFLTSKQSGDFFDNKTNEKILWKF